MSATEVISEGAEGIILESVLEGYAEYYSADLAEKVVRGMTDNALKCKFNGGTIPIGYVIDNEQHFQIDPITAPYVLEVFKQYDSGSTMTELRDWLNAEGVKNTRGNPITYNSIQHMLNNRRYIGEFAFRDTVIPDGIPAIVPQDLFDRVQEKLAVNKRPRPVTRPRTIICLPPRSSAVTAALISAARAAQAGRVKSITITSAYL